MLKLIQYLYKSKFVRNMSIVMSGTAFAQIIGFALIPIISRLFTPEDFGLFGSFNSVMLVVISGVTLQYSQAVMLPKREDEAANVFAISVFSVCVISLLVVLLMFLFPGWLLGIMNASNAKWLLWFLPLGVWIGGINQTFQAWCIRRKAFKRTSSSQIVRAGSNGVLQILFGLFHVGGGGLIISSVLANGTASLNLTHQVFHKDRRLLKNSLTWNKMREVAIEYRDFPIYAATQNVVNALSQGLPVLLLSHYYGIAVAGFYAFGVRLLKVPMNFVLIALRQVLFQKASETHNSGGRLLPLFVKLTAGLFAIAFVPSLILFIWAPPIFSTVFGEQWLIAGEYARWIVLWLMVAFCNVPSVLFAKVLRKQKQLFFYAIIQLSLRAASLVVGGLYLKAYTTIVFFSLVGIVLNSILIFWIGVSLLGKSKIDLVSLIGAKK